VIQGILIRNKQGALLEGNDLFSIHFVVSFKANSPKQIIQIQIPRQHGKFMEIFHSAVAQKNNNKY